MINLHVEGIQQQGCQFHQSGIDHRHIYLGRWFHFGKLYSLVRSQVTSSCLWRVSNKRCFSDSWCIFFDIHAVSWKWWVPPALSDVFFWHQYPQCPESLSTQHWLKDAAMLSDDAIHIPGSPSVALKSLYLSGWLLSNLFPKQTFIKYLLWTGLILGNVGGVKTTLTMTFLSQLPS